MATAARLNAILADADERSHRNIVTPEGVALPVELGARSERAAAFLIDLLIITGCFIALGLLALAAGLLGLRSNGDRGIAIWVWIALLLGWFLVRSFYFALFELRWHGSTPGKRVFRLRVIDRAGGALTADAVIARNLMREIEVFLPLTLIMVGLGTDMNGFIELAMLGWMLIFTFMPLFNRDRLRVGDMVGGTWVISAPKATLLPDLAAASGQRVAIGTGAARVRVHERAAGRLRHLRAADSGAGTAPGGNERRERARGGLQAHPTQDQLDAAARLPGRRASLPAGLLHRPARPPRGAGPARQAAQGQARPRGDGQTVSGPAHAVRDRRSVLRPHVSRTPWRFRQWPCLPWPPAACSMSRW